MYSLTKTTTQGTYKITYKDVPHEEFTEHATQLTFTQFIVYVKKNMIVSIEWDGMETQELTQKEMASIVNWVIEDMYSFPLELKKSRD